MKIIGAGLPRTGTMSMQAALNQLGYPCYHMQEVPMKTGHIEAWEGIISESRKPDWRSLFEGYEATVDGPACFYYRDLMREFPDAKIILTVREEGGWFRSVSALLGTIHGLRFAGYLIPRMRRFNRLALRLVDQHIGTGRTEADFVRAFNSHNDEVMRSVPAERLLVFRVQEGWRPLCEFLGCEPPEGDFPHLNEGVATVREKIRDVFMVGAAKKLGLLLTFLVGLSLIVWLVFG